jgi:hypothetical protein
MPQKKKRGKKVKSNIPFLNIISNIINLFLVISSLTFFNFNLAFSGDFRPYVSNQLEYSSGDNSQNEIFHDWLDFNLSYRVYDLGLRYEAHAPDDWGETFKKLSFRYLQLTPKFLDATLGNYYVIFGRGLILRSYENRDLRYDNNLDGIKASFDINKFDLTLLWGDPRGKYERVNDPLYGADGKIALLDWMSLGGSYLQTDISDFGEVQLYAGNLSFTFPHLDLYGEYARKENPKGEFINKYGKGLYLSSNLYYPGFGLTLEYKDYKRFDFSHGEVTYNNPPSLSKEHLYTLLNRHAYVLDLYDEKGIQAQVISTPQENLSLLANYSKTSDHKDRLIFSEIYAEIEYDYKDLATLKTGFSRLKNVKEEGSPYYLAPVFDLTYYLSSRNSLAFILEHLWTNKYEGKLTYYDQIISLSFSHSPTFSLTLAHERTTQWKTREWSEKKNWFIATLDWSLAKRQNLSLSIGSRRAGKVCSGGICTDKPALDGVEIKLLSQF